MSWNYILQIKEMEISYLNKLNKYLLDTLYDKLRY